MGPPVGDDGGAADLADNPGQLVEDRGGLPGGGPGAERALGGPRKVELILGSGEGNVQQAHLLAQLGPGRGVDDGDEPVLQSGDVDHRPFEALGPVEGDQIDGVVAAVDVAAVEGGEPGQEAGTGGGRFGAEIVVDQSAEGGQVAVPLHLAVAGGRRLVSGVVGRRGGVG